MTNSVESHKLSADIENLFDLITKFLYSSKEIFLRELISNASDALDKYRFMSSSDSSLPTDTDLRIDVIPSKSTNTLRILDTGCGMTRQDLIQNLSSIAHSGTKEFLKAAKDKLSDEALIGQFGVGFFSSFLVAGEVAVTSTSAQEKKTYLWKSKGNGNYTIEELEYSGKHGTEVLLTMKEEGVEYLEDEKLKEVVKKYNSFAAYPLYIHLLKEKAKPSPEKEDKEDDADKEEEGKIEEIKDEEEEDKKEEEKEFEVVEEKINAMEPIWRRKKEEVTEEQYEAFYKEISKDWDKHMAEKHFRVESTDLEFSAVLFVPARAPFDMFESKKKKNNIKLYVKRVFIMDDCGELLPDWLSFLHGVIDSEHLDLNVSREILQKSDVLKKIRKVLTKKALELITEIAEDAEKYEKLMSNFGKNLKLGIHEDAENREALSALLRFDSSKRSAVSLDRYIESYDKELEEKGIYYISEESKQAAEKSPFLEGYRKAGVEVLFLTETIDEYVATQLKEYKGFSLKNVTKEGVTVPGQKKEEKEDNEEDKKFFEGVKKVLEGEVEKVVGAKNLTDSPASVSSTDYGWSANMERIMKNQALKDNQMSSFMMGKKVFGLNMEHPIVTKLRDEEYTGDEFKKKVKTMFYASSLSCGYGLESKSSDFAGFVYEMMGKEMNVEIKPIVREEEKKEEENKEEEKVTELD